MHLQFIDKISNCIETLTFHLSNECHRNIFAHELVNQPNNCIENVRLISVTNHPKNNFFEPLLILGDLHNITKDLEMFTLILSHRINVHHKKVELTNFYNNHKI
jgi:hypothetical protein